MKRNYLIDEPIPLKTDELILQTAFHEAGHAAAIYLRNRQKQLPPVHFQISLAGFCTIPGRALQPNAKLPTRWIATVEGGHLIHSLPVATIENDCYFSDQESSDYQLAYEADIINLLVGPLAEAKYVAERDNELINARLVNVDSLKHYGGTSDLKKVDEYLDCLVASQRRREKLNELFLAAFQFIADATHWQAITDLARHIVHSDQDIIDCAEATSVLDRAMMSAARARTSPVALFRLNPLPPTHSPTL